MAEQDNLDTAKQGYSAFSEGDAAGAMENIADDVEWVIPGKSSVSGTLHGKEEVGEFWGKLAEKNFTTSPEAWFADGDRVVVLTHVTIDGGEADQADVLTYRDGKLAKFQSAIDTALFEEVFGSK